MDTSDPLITFDKYGVCNHCHQAQKSLREIECERPKYWELLHKILDSRKGKYDCLIGLSGGVDSSLVLHEVVKQGLKPLCFTVDNGWNDPKADENIMKLVETLEVPLYRYVIDQDKFKELQRVFIWAGVPNIEIPTDHILMAASYEIAAQYGIKYILSGGNVATESIMPSSWGYSARDLVHIKDIYRQYTGKGLTGLPLCSLIKWNWYHWIKGVKIVYPLDYISYNRKEAIKLLEKEYDYVSYGEKHCESLWTKWFQNYYLIRKFNYDKRKAHLSSLINSDQITREEALKIISTNPEYPDIGYEDSVLDYPRHSHYEYKTDEKTWLRISKIVKFLKKCFF